jgi:hypothetical protein
VENENVDSIFKISNSYKKRLKGALLSQLKTFATNVEFREVHHQGNKYSSNQPTHYNTAVKNHRPSSR